ncbi:MAG: hypothetical protein JXA96_13195 [Sedimentisphaerales bacterium]|nr:hypothetical protein [Sedimentisphaerales bacterium]
MNHKINRLYLIKPYCDKSSQQLIDHLIRTHKNITKTAKITAAIKDNIKNDRQLLYKLRRITARFDMISKQLDARVNAAIKSQNRCLNTANRVLNKHFISQVLGVFAGSITEFKADIVQLKKTFQAKSKDSNHA